VSTSYTQYSYEPIFIQTVAVINYSCKYRLLGNSPYGKK